MRTVLDLFSAAAGGWSLGMHRAGFETVAACEAEDWRRILYAENNPGIPIYDDVRTLTADRIVSRLGYLPDIVVGSPPCQDISSANTSGKGVEGERSGLFFEAIRIIGEVRPRWFALENSANLRTRGADDVLAALERLGYACWPLVVRASDIGANHERPRSWLIGCDLEQVTDPDGHGRPEGRCRRRVGIDLPVQDDHLDAAGIRHESGWTWRHRPYGDGAAYAGDATGERRSPWTGNDESAGREDDRRELADLSAPGCAARDASDASGRQLREQSRRRDGESWADPAFHEDVDSPNNARKTPDPDQARQAHGRMEPSLRQEEIADDGCGDGRGSDEPGIGQMAIRAHDSERPDRCGPLWSLDDLAGRLRLDDGIPARLAGTRIAVGGPRGTAAASLIVEAYGDAVVPEITEAIGRAILRTETALAAIYERQAA